MDVDSPQMALKEIWCLSLNLSNQVVYTRLVGEELGT